MDRPGIHRNRVIATPEAIRIGLIGLGQWGKNYIPTLRAVPDVRLEYVAANTARKKPPDLDVPYTSDWRELVHADNIDAVIVATPPQLHAEMARECISAGKPALIEKPLTLDLPSAQEILALAENQKVTLLVNHIHLFNEAWRVFKAAVRAAGGVRRIEAIAGRWGPFRPDVPVLWDWGPHDIAMCIDLLGASPESVHARKTETRDTAEGVGETLSLGLRFPSNVGASIEISNLYPAKRRKFTAYTDTGDVSYEDVVESSVLFNPNQTHSSNGRPVAYPCPNEPPLNRAVSRLAACARSGTCDLSDLEQAIAVIACLEKANQHLHQAAT